MFLLQHLRHKYGISVFINYIYILVKAHGAFVNTDHDYVKASRNNMLTKIGFSFWTCILFSYLSYELYQCLFMILSSLLYSKAQYFGQWHLIDALRGFVAWAHDDARFYFVLIVWLWYWLLLLSWPMNMYHNKWISAGIGTHSTITKSAFLSPVSVFC